MKIIDLETFPRRSHYEFFKSYAYPYMGMTANVDVTNLYNAAKNRGGSPFLAFLWAAANAANAVPELRQRMVGEGIAQYDHCDTAHTVALPDGTFVNCRTDCRRSFDEFLVYGKQCQEEAKGRHGFVQPGDDETELIFVSSTPWVTFTQVIQPTPIPADSNVRIVFGKFFEQNGRKLMPLAIQVNHALVDGLHVGQFYQRFQELADSDLKTAAPHAYDSSRDYEKYPTFAPLPTGMRASAPIKENTAWKNNVLRSDEITWVLNLDERKKHSVFGSQYRREQIQSVTFLDTLAEMPADAWDASEAGNRSVMAWVKPNGELYDLYIGAEGGMRTGESCAGMFAGYVNAERITFGSALHTKGARSMSAVFNGCGSLRELDLSSFDTSNVTNMEHMFDGCGSLRELDLSSFDTSNVTNMSNMFQRCGSLRELDLSSFDTSNVTNMSWMFDGCGSLRELDLSSFDTSNVTNMSWMFEGCGSLRELDLSSFDTSRVENMVYMFHDCTTLTRLDLSSFDTSNVMNMFGMFLGCSSLTELDLSRFGTSKVANMSWMFANCISLTILDLSSFDTSNVREMCCMFAGCGSLRELDLSSFDTSKVLDMSFMFRACESLNNLNLSSFNTFNVQNMNSMFWGCVSLTNLNLSSFDTPNVQNMESMFRDCSSLRKLNLNSFNISKVRKKENMFDNCPAGSNWRWRLR